MLWAVIVAGGSGSRFWPLSTPAHPKQLLPLAGPRSTAEETVARLAGLVDPERILLVTGPRLAPLIRDRLGLDPRNVLIEPAAKSTGPALLWATHEAGRRDPDAIVLCQHADWHVPAAGQFAAAAERAFETALTERALVTVGIVPTRPETGYGYIVPGPELGPGIHRVAEFLEKPNAERAARLIGAGALWNSGLFCWAARELVAEVGRVAPELAAGLPALDRGDVAGYFEACREISIDVGVLERSQRVAVVRGDFAWDDVGTWDALGRVRQPDGAGNVTIGAVSAVDATGCVVWSQSRPIVVAGVADLVVVEANGRVLVTTKARAPGLKAVLDALPPSVREI